MAFGDLTQRPFEGAVRDSFEETAQRLSDSAKRTKQDYSAEWRTRHGNLNCIFKPTGRVEITWRDRGGIKEGWYMKDWAIATVIRRAQELLNS